jgi:hypothetical protein
MSRKSAKPVCEWAAEYNRMKEPQNPSHEAREPSVAAARVKNIAIVMPIWTAPRREKTIQLMWGTHTAIGTEDHTFGSYPICSL